MHGCISLRVRHPFYVRCGTGSSGSSSSSRPTRFHLLLMLGPPHAAVDTRADQEGADDGQAHDHEPHGGSVKEVVSVGTRSGLAVVLSGRDNVARGPRRYQHAMGDGRRLGGKVGDIGGGPCDAPAIVNKEGTAGNVDAGGGSDGVGA